MVTLQVTIQVRCSTFHRASRLCASGCTLSLHHSHESTCALCVERVANNNREGRAGKSGRCRRCPSRKPLGSAPGDGQAATAEVQTRLRDLQSTSPTLPQCAPQERALRARAGLESSPLSPHSDKGSVSPYQTLPHTKGQEHSRHVRARLHLQLPN